VPADRTFLGQVQESINSGATIVQLREKELSTRDFIERAKKVHELTRAAGVPLIINDRVDVALAVDAEGVHVGQDDMDVTVVRKLIGPGKLVGVSVSNVEEARAAIRDKESLDYVGIGAVFDTSTKKLAKRPQGASGVRDVLRVLHREGGDDIKTVAIGGINERNTTAVLYTSAVEGKSLDGVAVVSAIIASPDAGAATKRLVELVKNGAKALPSEISSQYPRAVSDIVSNVTKIEPLTHQITNSVVKNFSANVTLSIGASPIMSESVADYEQLARIPNAGLLINAGTVNVADSFKIYSAAVSAYNNAYKPIVFDPVAAGASSFRKQVSKDIVNCGYFTAIKGNQAEILTLADVENIEMKGVDSGEYAQEDIIQGAKKLALATRSIVVVTGKNDIVVEGNLSGSNLIPEGVKQKAVVIKGGHEFMGKITGSGCSLGSVITSYLAANPTQPFSAVVTAVSLYKHAGAVAGELTNDKGPGSFMASFLDELHRASVQNDPSKWTVTYSDL
jgi:thiamine-phosphate diphosphorylase/hydroxyethylthiazole kinase